jgi:SPP1 gp7 family putative phage head morphogenesis protein
MASRFLDRLFGRSEPHSLAIIEPKRLLPAEVKDAPPPETKSSSLALLPTGAYGESYIFFSPDGGRTMLDLADGPTTLAFLAYWYVATRWRAQKIAEPPLMVVAEDQDSGADEWIEDHELVDLLDTPSPDYDMGELLETTSVYLDNTGSVLWVKDYDNVGRVARLTPFSRYEFEPKRDDTRMFAEFRVTTANGPETFAAEDCIFFRDSSGATSWGRGKARLDIAMSWLKLGAKAQQTIYDLLNNSVWPSGVITTDKDWDPDPDTYKLFKQDVQQYAKAGNKGKPFIALGGGKFESLQAKIRDLVPDEVLGRVESIVAAVSGVPAIVLQFQIGMENSPWSQMEQARRMAYDDCVAPTWRKMERVLTRQLLRLVDDDTTHFIRFDPSNVASLQMDQLTQVQIATMMGRAASLNERRSVMGLEPIDPADDPNGDADKIPELTQPSFADILAGTTGSDKKPTDPNAPKDTTPADAAKKTRAAKIERKIKIAALQDAFREEAIPLYTAVAQRQLKVDSDRIVEIVMHMLLDPEEGKTEGRRIEFKARGKDEVMKAVNRYLAEDGRKAWTRTMTPLNEASAQRAGAVVASDLNLNFSLLHGNLLTYARKQTGAMITKTNKTTQSLISDIIEGGIDAQKSTREIARVISEATGFDRSRAELIARTETTKAFNGAPTESLSVLGQTTDRIFTKQWSGVLDDKERDEHVAMEGETVGIDEEFSNGLQYPSEPNCRCSLLFDEITEE